MNGYMHQDNIVKRKFNMNEYINHNELYEQYKKQKQCIHCGAPFELILPKNNKINCNVTVDRKDNTIAHIKNNCVLSCVECNRMKNNNKKFQVLYYMGIIKKYYYDPKLGFTSPEKLYKRSDGYNIPLLTVKNWIKKQSV